MADISDLVRRMLALRKVSSSDAEVFERMGPMDPEDYSILQSVLSIAPHSFKHPLTGTSYLSGATTEALAAVEGVQDSRRGEAVTCHLGMTCG